MIPCEFIYHQQQVAIVQQFYLDKSQCSNVIQLERAQCNFNAITTLNHGMQDAERAFFQCDLCAGDYSADEQVDVDDLLIVVNNWQVVGADGLLQVVENWGMCK